MNDFGYGDIVEIIGAVMISASTKGKFIPMLIAITGMCLVIVGMAVKYHIPL